MKNLRLLVSTYKVYRRKHLLCHIYSISASRSLFILWPLQWSSLTLHLKDKEKRWRQRSHSVDHSVVAKMLLGNKSHIVGKSGMFLFFKWCHMCALPVLTSLVFAVRRNSGPLCPHQKTLFCWCSNQHSFSCNPTGLAARPDGQTHQPQCPASSKSESVEDSQHLWSADREKKKQSFWRFFFLAPQLIRTWRLKQGLWGAVPHSRYSKAEEFYSARSHTF